MLGSGAQLGGGTEGALRVVLMRDRAPEDGQDGVAAQLVHDAVEAHDRAAVHQEQGQERERPAARDASVPATRELDLDRSEDSELALHLVRA